MGVLLKRIVVVGFTLTAGRQVHSAPVCGLRSTDIIARVGLVWQIAQSGPETETMAPRLNCLNRLGRPYATAFNMRINSEERPSSPLDQQTAVWSAGKEATAGFFIISPNRSWYSRPPIHKPSNSVPGYFLYFRDRKGVDKLFRYYVFPDGRGAFGAGPTERGKGFPDESQFDQIGKPGDEISPEQAMTGTREEIITRMKTMPRSTESFIRFERMRLGRNIRTTSLADVKTILCECARIEDPIINAQAKAVASDLKIGDIDECFPAWISMYSGEAR